MFPRSRDLLIALAIPGCLMARAQGLVDLHSELDGGTVIVRGHAGGSESGQPLVQATWRATEEGTVFELQRPTEPDGTHALMLDRLVECALGAFLDARLHFSREGVLTDGSPDQLLAGMNLMVWSAADEIGASGLFDGFSAPTRDQLIRLTHIDWSRTRFSIDGDGEQDKYVAIYRYVRSQRDELERQLRADLLPLSTINVLAIQQLPPGRTEPINSTCGTVFDQNNFLCALNLTVSDSGIGMPEPELALDISEVLRASAEPPAPEVKLRKRDRWLKTELDQINQRIDQLDQRKELWTLRDRMDDMQAQIDDIRLEMREPVEPPGASENPIANLSVLTGRNITIRFGRNSAGLDAEYRVLLNEVFEQLARSPGDRVLITGYTDRSGDTAVNLALSEQRAKAVRNYLLRRGIASERLLVNYYGDSHSTGRDPNERRVELEWLMP